MRSKTILILCLLAATTAVVAPAVAYEREIVLVQATQISWQGLPAWEYYYDIWGSPVLNFRLKDFDSDGVLNFYDGGFYDKWSGTTAGYEGWYYYYGQFPSYGEGDGDDTWYINPSAEMIARNYWIYDATYSAIHGVMNPIHSPSEYEEAAGDMWWGGSARHLVPDGYDGISFNYGEADYPDTLTGLQMTIRLIHTDGPNGTLSIDADGWALNPETGHHGNTVVGPGLRGDFDGDFDVDADDIDLLADAIALGSYDAIFDVNDDSVLDEQDLIDHIATLVERTGGVGTYRGDFNLDGYVDGTDLAILKAGFGLTGLGYALGNCNSDDFVDGTDLAIFKATFGFSGTPGAPNPDPVPEPATMALLGLGAAALLRRRK